MKDVTDETHSTMNLILKDVDKIGEKWKKNFALN